MTTQWNGALNEEARVMPSHSHAGKAPHNLNANMAPPPQHSELLGAMEANEVFLGFPEVTPDYSHCGINE